MRSSPNPQPQPVILAAKMLGDRAQATKGVPGSTVRARKEAAAFPRPGAPGVPPPEAEAAAPKVQVSRADSLHRQRPAAGTCGCGSRGGEREPVSRTEPPPPAPHLPFGRTHVTIGPRWEMLVSALLMAEQRQTDSAAGTGAWMSRTLPSSAHVTVMPSSCRYEVLMSLVRSASFFFFLKQ